MPYVFDPTGSSPGNLIPDELHTLTEVNDVTYRIIVPEFAPFYTNNLVVKYNDGVNGDVILQEDVDYALCLPYLAASRSVGSMVYGGISFNYQAPSGTIKITYQTIGGEWIADPNYIYERLVNTAYNPRVTVWDVLTNVQQIFPPVNHNQMLDYIYDSGDLILKLQQIADAITGSQPHTFNLGVNLEPDKIMVTDNQGIVTTGDLSAAQMLTIFTNYANIVNQLNTILQDINGLQNQLNANDTDDASLDARISTLENIIQSGGNLPQNLSNRLIALENDMAYIKNMVAMLLMAGK